MVKLSSVPTQYPWNKNASPEWSDKEIHTQTVRFEDATSVWTVPIYPCLPTYAYLGYRIVNSTQTCPLSVRLISGDGKHHPLFSDRDSYQNAGAAAYSWTQFRYPLTERFLSLNEDEPMLEIVFPSECYGKVEFLAQELEELEDASFKDYWYCERDTSQKGWILTKKGMFYMLPTSVKNEEYPNAVSLYSL